MIGRASAATHAPEAAKPAAVAANADYGNIPHAKMRSAIAQRLIEAMPMGAPASDPRFSI